MELATQTDNKEVLITAKNISSDVLKILETLEGGVGKLSRKYEIFNPFKGLTGKLKQH